MVGPIQNCPGSWGCGSLWPRWFRSQFAKNREISEHYPSRLMWIKAQDLSTGFTDCYSLATQATPLPPKSEYRFAIFARAP